MMREKEVTNSVIKYLIAKQYRIKNYSTTNKHGPDIVTYYHYKSRKQYIIEAKGDAGKKLSTRNPVRHNAFYYMLGQILSRMGEQSGNSFNRSRIYALAVPKTWETMFSSKVKKMANIWRLLKLHIFLVDEKGNVENYPHSHFLH